MVLQVANAVAKDIVFDNVSRKKMQDGINKLADAVGVTLGPRGALNLECSKAAVCVCQQSGSMLWWQLVKQAELLTPWGSCNVLANAINSILIYILYLYIFCLGVAGAK